MVASPQTVGPIADSEVEILERARPKIVSDVPAVNSSVRIPALDGLRGIAILLVLLHHAVFTVRTGSQPVNDVLAAGRLAWSGVDLFFVLSGFLIGGILLDARESPNYFKTFYARRAYRILPLYGAVLVLYSTRFLPIHGVAGSLGSLSASPIPWMSYLTFTQNVWMAWLGTFGVTTMTVTWSLAVEEQFYLTTPLVVRKIGPSRLVVILVTVILTAPLLRTGLHLFFRSGNFAAYVLMPCRADALSLGVLAAVLVRKQHAWNFLLVRRDVVRWLTGLLFVGVIGFTFRGQEFSTPMVTVGYSWLALFYTGLLLLSVTAKGGVLVRALCNRGLMQLGVLAYCTYLIHLPVMEACRRIVGLRLNPGSATTQILGGLMGIAVALIAAKFSWHFFEKPLLRRGHVYKY